MKKFYNINESFGERISFDSVDEMEKSILACGYKLPEDGLKENRDYEIIDSTEQENDRNNRFQEFLDSYKKTWNNLTDLPCDIEGCSFIGWTTEDFANAIENIEKIVKHDIEIAEMSRT